MEALNAEMLEEKVIPGIPFNVADPRPYAIVNMNELLVESQALKPSGNSIALQAVGVVMAYEAGIMMYAWELDVFGPTCEPDIG